MIMTGFGAAPEDASLEAASSAIRSRLCPQKGTIAENRFFFVVVWFSEELIRES